MIVIDESAGMVKIITDGQEVGAYPLWSAEGFAELSRIWLKSGLYVKHVYSFTWLGRPVIQLPEDLLRIQEVIYRIRPQIIIETGIAHGGSLIFYASLLKLLGGGRVVGVDVEIRPHNRAAIEAHELFPLITLIEGNSVDPVIIDRVKAHCQGVERALVILDSKHTRDHVLAELEAYAPLVSVGSYAIAADGIMEQVAGASRIPPEWAWDNPRAAARAFVERYPDFVIEEPAFSFNEGLVDRRITYWQGGFIKRIR
jgi:cephalosporin hydroxylase